ncbi:MAG TPA: extracellular solute-binding protein [Symbiobacteriaceae bacterium]|nr:extracellular solute-binding protein [Symbiobacteriaceae bacterium]
MLRNRMVALCLSAVLLAGCSAGATPAGGTQAPPPSSDKATALTIYAPTGLRREALDDAIEVYEEKHPNTKIRVRELPPQQMMTKDGGFNPATVEGGDIVLVPDGQAQGMYAAGMLRDLSSIRAPQLNDLTAPLYDELGVKDGKRYGLPYSLTPGLIMANPDALSRAGVKMPTVDWTVQDFEQAVVALHAAGASYFLPLNSLIDPLVRAYGGAMYDADRQAWAFDTPEARQGLSLVGRLTRDGVLTAGTANTKIIIGNGPGAPALSILPAKAGVMMSGMTMLPFPKGPKGRSTAVSAQVGAVLNTSADPEAAADFLKELISNPAAQQALAKGGVRPVIDDAKAIAAWQESVGSTTAQAIDLSLEGAHVESVIPNYADALTGLEPFFTGRATLDEVVPGLIARLQ